MITGVILSKNFKGGNIINISTGEIIFASITAIIASFVLTYPVKYLAPKFGFMDIPKDERRMHTEPKPRLGGLAIFSSFIIVMCICRLFDILIPYAVGGLIVVVMGLADDKISIKPWQKLAAQALSAISICCFGITIERLSFFGYNLELGIFAYPATVIWVIAITNIFNLIDGLDGLCCGLSIICASCFALIAYLLGLPEIAVCALIFVFSCIGHLPHNIHPAKIFIGDTGAMLCGFVLATLSIEAVFCNENSASAFIPIVVFGIPLFDSVYAVFRRIGKQSIFMGDKEHIHHRLSKRYGHPLAVILLYGANIVLAGIALIMTNSVNSEIAGVILMLLSISYAVIRFVHYKF